MGQEATPNSASNVKPPSLCMYVHVLVIHVLVHVASTIIYVRGLSKLCGNLNLIVTLGRGGLVRLYLAFAKSAQQATCIERPIVLAIEVKKHVRET